MSRKHRRRAAAATGRGNAQTAPAPVVRPGEVKRLFGQAVRAYESGQLRYADTLCRQVVEASPRHCEALHLLGVLAHEEARDEEAAQWIERAIAAGSRDPLCYFNLGEVRRARDEFEPALASYDRALALDATLADAHYGRGNALFELKRYEESAEAYRRALRLVPDDVELHNNLGNVLVELGEREAAMEHYRRAIQLQPDYAEAHVNLGNVLRDLGRLAEAEASCRRALSLDSGLAGAHFNLGLTLEAQNRQPEALPCYAAAIERDPARSEAHRALANVLVQRGNFKNALKHYRRAQELHPESVQAALDLAGVLQLLERFEEALEWLRRALELDPDSADAHARMGDCHQQLGRFDDAMEHFREALRIKPGAEIHQRMAVVLENEGRLEEAVEHHQQALALNPDLVPAYFRLASNKRFRFGPDELQRMTDLLERSDLTVADRISLNFALGEVLDREGDTERAFQYLQTGNALRAAQLPFDRDRYRGHYDRVIEVYSAEFFAARKDFGVDSEAPVFIVGLPRSGSTLVEQIISSHPEVFGAGELLHVPQIAQSLQEILGSQAEYPECVRELDVPTSARLARDYLKAAGQRAGGASRICDKLLGNYARLGLIALLFPKARVINCRRDPRDTCLSCYFHYFTYGMHSTYDLGHLGFVYRLYEQIMAYWRRALPLPVLDVQYEELVSDQELHSRRLIEFLGLPWDDRCLQFHKQERDVRTASFWQVRQPLYRSSVGRWKAYEKHLGPLFEALGEAEPAGQLADSRAPSRS